MAAMDSGAPKYCYGFQIGNCRFGAKCIFKHEKDPDHKAVPGKQDALEKQRLKKKPGEKKIFRDFSKVGLNPAHQKIVGAPRGKVGPYNLQGYSMQQREVIKSLIATEDIEEVHQPLAFSTWSRPDAQEYRSISAGTLGVARLNMLRISSSSPVKRSRIDRSPSRQPQSSSLSSFQGDSQPSQRRKQEPPLPITRLIVRSPSKKSLHQSASPHHSFSPMVIRTVPSMSDTHLNTTAASIMHNCQMDPTRIVAHIRVSLLATATSQPILTIFGWAKAMPFLDEFSTAPNAIRDGTYGFLYHITNIGISLLGAKCVRHSGGTTMETGQYSNFGQGG